MLPILSTYYCLDHKYIYIYKRYLNSLWRYQDSFKDKICNYPCILGLIYLVETSFDL